MRAKGRGYLSWTRETGKTSSHVRTQTQTHSRSLTNIYTVPYSQPYAFSAHITTHTHTHTHTHLHSPPTPDLSVFDLCPLPVPSPEWSWLTICCTVLHLTPVLAAAAARLRPSIDPGSFCISTLIGLSKEEVSLSRLLIGPGLPSLRS